MYNDLQIRKIYNIGNKQEHLVNKDVLSKVLKNIISTHPFSTFPYIVKNHNSCKAHKKLSSGNCIALSMAAQDKLRRDHNISSTLIPATIPNRFKDPGYLDIAHVALYVPESKQKGYILDPAFYFKEPMEISHPNIHKNIPAYPTYNNNDNNNNNNNNNNFYNMEIDSDKKYESSYEKKYGDIKSTNSCKMRNLYDGEDETIKYDIGTLMNKLILNKHQTLPRGTKYIEGSTNKDLTDKWRYYLTEIVNPDSSIGNYYINIKRKPFICITDDDYNMKLYIKFLDDNNMKIQKYGKTIYEGPPHKLDEYTYEHIRPIIQKYFGYQPLKFLRHNYDNADKQFVIKDHIQNKLRSLQTRKIRPKYKPNSRGYMQIGTIGGIGSIGGKWSRKYKKSINCRKPKGFSQKQHCKYGRQNKSKKQQNKEQKKTKKRRY